MKWRERRTRLRVALLRVRALVAMASALGVFVAMASPHVLAQASGRAAAQTPATVGTPADALSGALTAACREDENAFASHLVAENARAFAALPMDERTALMKRFVLLDGAGKPLLSSTPQGDPIIRCEAQGVVAELRFGPVDTKDNLAFIPVEVPPLPNNPNGQTQSVRFGLVREDGQWKVLSVGLLLLDIPEIARSWEASDLVAREKDAVAALRMIAEMLKAYQEAFGRLPEGLDQLGPAPNGISPDSAGLIDAQMAKGESGGYRFRYTIQPAAGGGDEPARDKAAGFALAATPIAYGKDGKRSFYLDSSGTLRGADKQGVVATVADPIITEGQP